MSDVGTVEKIVAVDFTDGSEGFVAGLAEGFTGGDHHQDTATGSHQRLGTGFRIGNLLGSHLINPD